MNNINDNSSGRGIGLYQAVFILVGFVVGSAIFVLPGALAVDAGPSVFIAYILASIPALFSCFVMAQIGGCFPSNGANFIVINRVLSPYMGFIYVWISISLSALVIPFVSIGFSEYLSYFFPNINVVFSSILIILFFVIANSVGVSVAANFQAIMVFLFLLVLIVFGVSGFLKGDSNLLKPMFPNGYFPTVIATITAYLSYAGVFVIAQIAGEIKNPSKNIPKSIVIGFSIILFIYAMVPLSLVMTLHWSEYKSSDISVVIASQSMFPGWVTYVVVVGAIFAAATSVNGLLMGISRDFYRGSTSGIFPKFLSKINKNTGSPVRAILVIGGLSVIGVSFGASVKDYAQIAVLWLMVTQVITGFAVLRLPKVMPDEYQNSKFKISERKLSFFCWGYMFFSVLFFVFLGLDNPSAVYIGLIYLLIGSIYYKVRSKGPLSSSYP